MALHTSILYAGIFGLLFIYLSVEVVKLRAQYQVRLGDEGHLDLLKAIRIHGNFAEYVPLALVLFSLSELIGGRSWMLHTLGITLIIGRVLHIMGLRKTDGPSVYRILGVLLTWVVILILSVFCFISGLIPGF
jgi:uncharacterized membrane protein YecN with MAPEG domain